MTSATASHLLQSDRKPPELEEFFQTREDENPRVRKEYDDFRDRAAYVYVTGSFPTHLRTFFTALLRKATRYSPQPVSADGRIGNVATRPEVVKELELDKHPMVLKVREYVEDGWKMQQAPSVTDRRPYSKVFLYKEAPQGRGIRRMTVQADGSVKEGW